MKNNLEKEGGSFSKFIEEKDTAIMSKIDTLQKSIDQPKTALFSKEELENISQKIALLHKLNSVLINNNNDELEKNINKAYEKQKEVTQRLKRDSYLYYPTLILLNAKVLHNNPVIQNNELVIDYLYKKSDPTIYFEINSI